MEEEFKPIEGYEGLYEISNFGNIRSLLRQGSDGRLLRKNINYKNGYESVSLYNGTNRKTFYVHRLVAKAFVFNPQGKYAVNHINGIRNDNRVENLEWVTNRENQLHAIKIGLYDNRGEKNPLSKLTKLEVLKIRNLKRIYNYTNSQLAQMFNTSRENIGCIVNYKTWRSLV